MCLPTIHKAFNGKHCRKVVHTSNPRAWEAETRGSEVKFTHGHRLSLRPAWDYMTSLSQNRVKEEEAASQGFGNQEL